ncbi:DNA mismatch repair ATPase [uncultured virus]|nr:DNA mismatch repair ATPase [uncultured virus]
MPIITEYLTLQKKYEAQYGERTIVLMQVGTFYEIFSYDVTYCTTPEARIDKDGNVWNESIGHSIEMSVILNSVLTHENGNEPYGIQNPHKVGFPVIAYEKYRNTILSNDYVIIRVDQEKSNGTKGPVNRFVAEVCSPTMQLDHIALTRPTSNIACIYIEYVNGGQNQQKFDNFLITTGVAVVDVITGQNRVCEFYSKAEDQIHAVQELYRFLISHYPRELIIHVSDMPAGMDKHTEAVPNPYVKYLERMLELRRFDRLTTHVNTVPADFKKIPYQIEFFNKIFNKKPETAPAATGIRLNIIQKRNEQIIEELGLERMNYGRIAYMLLMQHCHSHNADIIARLSKPDLQWLDERKHLVLTHNAIVQLDLVPGGGKDIRLMKRKEIDSLMTVLDQNQTHLGRRLLYTLLQNPMSNAEDISIYYNMVTEMLANVPQIANNQTPDPLWLILDRQLRELPDIGRLQRKLEIKLITPKELSVLYKAYIKIIGIYVSIIQTKSPTLHKQMFNNEDVANFNQFIARFAGLINFDSLECCHIDTSESNNKYMDFVECPIRQGAFLDIDQQAQQLLTAENTLQQIVDHLNQFLARTTGKKITFKSAKKKQGAVKQDPTGTVLTTTEAKSRTLLASSVDINLCGTLQILPYTSAERIISSDKIAALCAQIDGTRNWLRYRLMQVYDLILEEMVTKYNFYIAVASFVAKMDLVHSYAHVSHTNNYHRPDLAQDDGEVSFLEAREIRHPIIEKIIDGAFVTNDVMLGAGYLDENKVVKRTNGMLLYGVNASGKSSLTKAVALIIIMAQIGCFVPALLRYRPYYKLITRLNKEDDIFKGMSSFAVEMSELRTILRQADSNTLTVGDELCNSSETHSGMAIVTGAILSLIEKKSTFIFATHMHELLNLSYIRNIPPEILKICHISISLDETNKILIYDRKLKDGAGLSIYGIMVAKSLDLPDEFIGKANEVLLEITGQNREIVPFKHTKYNAQVYMDACTICGKTGHQTQLHTHHLQEQHLADERGFIGAMHKNIKDNLVILCVECHTKLHATGQDLKRIETSIGKLVIAVEN